MNAPIHDPSVCETQPPPPMPRMTPRDDSPRLVTRPGAESRYWRARAAQPVVLPESLLEALKTLRMECWECMPRRDKAVECECGQRIGDDDEDHGRSYWICLGPRCSLRCVAYAVLAEHHPEQRQDDAAVDAVLAEVAAMIARGLVR